MNLRTMKIIIFYFDWYIMIIILLYGKILFFLDLFECNEQKKEELNY